MDASKENKIKSYDRYIMQGGDMTLDEIEHLVKESLGVSDIPLKMDMFDDFMTMIIEELNNRKD
tara:strand:- start:158 stop:349 length:192 start_codon:yes stop_codon:yes gene_type:complete